MNCKDCKHNDKGRCKLKRHHVTDEHGCADGVSAKREKVLHKATQAKKV